MLVFCLISGIKDTTNISTHEEFNVTLSFNMILVISWDDKRLMPHSILQFNPSFCSFCLFFLANWWMDWLKADDSRTFAVICTNICVKRKKNSPLYKCPELQWEHCEGTSKLLLLVSKAFWLLCLWSEGMLPPEREFEIHM